MGIFQGWQPGELIAVGGSVLVNIGLAIREAVQWWERAKGTDIDLAMRGWARAKDLEALVELLRRIIDRMRRQQNAYATSFELLLVVVPEQPTLQQKRALERAEELFETALLEPPSAGGEGGGGS